jgi:hypothetical protein
MGSREVYGSFSEKIRRKNNGTEKIQGVVDTIGQRRVNFKDKLRKSAVVNNKQTWQKKHFMIFKMMPYSGPTV